MHESSIQEYITSLFEKLTPYQIEDLISEHMLRKDSYEFYYAVDCDDIKRHCFPCGIDGTEFEKKENGDINYPLITDIITAYEDFFSEININNPVYFLDEYIPELQNLKKEIIDRIKMGSFYLYTNNFYNYIDGGETLSPKEDFTLFISIATGNLKNGAQRYNAILQNEYFIIKHEDLPNPILKNAFQSTYEKSIDLSFEVYNVFKEITIKKRLRASKKIDGDAIARVIELNRSLINQKKIFLFLSSNEYSFNVFQKLITKKWYSPVISHKSFNFHRSVEQLFLNRLIKDLDYSEKLERLEQLKNFLAYREIGLIIEDDKLKNDPDYLLLKEKVLQGFQELAEKYINFNFARNEQFKKIDELNKQLEDNKAYLKFGKLKILFKRLQEFASEYSTPEENIKEIEKLEKAFAINEIFFLVFKKAFQSLVSRMVLNISRGGDYIVSTGHHLPIVFRTSSEPFYSRINQIIELYLSEFAFLEKKIDENALLRIKKELNDLIDEMYEDKFDDISLESKLVFCLYLLVLPQPRGLWEKKNNEYVEDFLSDLIQKLEESNVPTDLRSDCLYIISWVNRRNTHYFEAKKYALKGINEFPEDPRFDHSLFLIETCIMSYHQINSLEMYEYKLGLIKSAADKYPSFLLGKSIEVEKNIKASLINSEVYTRIKIIEIKEELSQKEKEKEVNLLREKINNLKRYLGVDIYRKYPEFLHTEAHLELQESRILIKLEDKENKLEWAGKTLNESIKIAKQLIGYKIDDFKTLEDSIANEKIIISRI